MLLKMVVKLRVVGMWGEDRERGREEGIVSGSGSASGSRLHTCCIGGVYDLVIVMCQRASAQSFLGSE